MLAAALATTTFGAHRAEACLAAVASGDKVDIAQEQALLVWDPAQHTEHFVRMLKFDSHASNLGFVVPVPEVPEVAEADAKAFTQLHELAFPVSTSSIVFEGGMAWPWIRFEGSRAFFVQLNGLKSASADGLGVVQVERTLQVAGFEVSVLASNSADALGQWLQQNGYEQPHGFEKWADHYVQQKWHFAAFKMIRTANGDHPDVLQTRAIRLSFHADKPYFPYLEPRPVRFKHKHKTVVDFEPQPAPRPTEGDPDPALEAPEMVSMDGDRIQAMPSTIQDGSWVKPRLELFVVAPNAMSGVLDDGKSWPVQVAVSDSFELSSILEGVLPKGQVPTKSWLTAFRDPMRIRPMNELFFTSSESSEARPPRVDYKNEMPLVIRWPAFILAPLPWAGLWWRRRREREVSPLPRA
jgi:hypothetical protein